MASEMEFTPPRIVLAIRAMDRVVQAGLTVLGSQPPTEDALRKLADVLADYEQGDSYDAVTDLYYEFGGLDASEL